MADIEHENVISSLSFLDDEVLIIAEISADGPNRRRIITRRRNPRENLPPLANNGVKSDFQHLMCHRDESLLQGMAKHMQLNAHVAAEGENRCPVCLGGFEKQGMFDTAHSWQIHCVSCSAPVHLVCAIAHTLHERRRSANEAIHFASICPLCRGFFGNALSDLADQQPDTPANPVINIRDEGESRGDAAAAVVPVEPTPGPSGAAVTQPSECPPRLESVSSSSEEDDRISLCAEADLYLDTRSSCDLTDDDEEEQQMSSSDSDSDDDPTSHSSPAPITRGETDQEVVSANTAEANDVVRTAQTDSGTTVAADRNDDTAGMEAVVDVEHGGASSAAGETAQVTADIAATPGLDPGTLPPGWERRQMASGRSYFVDHNNSHGGDTQRRASGEEERTDQGQAAEVGEEKAIRIVCVRCTSVNPTAYERPSQDETRPLQKLETAVAECAVRLRTAQCSFCLEDVKRASDRFDIPNLDPTDLAIHIQDHHAVSKCPMPQCHVHLPQIALLLHICWMHKDLPVGRSIACFRPNCRQNLRSSAELIRHFASSGPHSIELYRATEQFFICQRARHIVHLDDRRSHKIICNDRETKSNNINPI